MISSENLNNDTLLSSQAVISSSNEEISNQNFQYELAAGIGSYAMRSIVYDDIYNKQIDSFVKVLQGSRNIDYEVLGQRASQLESEIEVLHSSFSEEERALEEDRILALELTPERQLEIEAAYNAEISIVRQDKIKKLQDELQLVYDQIALIGEGWPIPLVISPEDRKALHDAQDSFASPTDVVDIIPVTPERYERSARVAEEIRKYKVENPSLSADVLEYLTGRLGETISVDDLIEYCYGPVGALKSKDEYLRYRSKITGALGPEVYGRKIGDILNRSGFILQYGERRFFEEVDGRRRQRSRYHRIYRVILADDLAGDKDGIVGDELGAIDTWNSSDVFQDSSLEPDFSNENAAFAEILDESPQTDITETLVPMTEKKHSSGDQQPSWQKKLVEDTNHAIDQMTKDCLFYEDGNKFTVAEVGHRAASSKIGTKTSCEHLAAAGLMGGFKNDSYKRINLTRNQIVYSYLINTHPELKDKKTRKKACDVVDTIIGQRLAELNDQK